MTNKISLDAVAREQGRRATASGRGRSARGASSAAIEHALRQTVVALTAGSTLAEQPIPARPRCTCWRGRIRLVAGELTWEGRAGDLLTVPDARHRLEALEDAAILLTAVPRGGRVPPDASDRPGHASSTSTPTHHTEGEPPMLSEQNRPIVEATLPVVGQHIGEIAGRFYGHMFAAHPELLDGIFNRGNQARGEQQQALAGSVAAFASALVKTPEQLPEHLLSRIAHKHASLGIRPDQYQVVHDNLFWAIVDVLGEAVTPEVAAAWDEVYWLMAYALINQERGLYSARGVRPETVWRDWRVDEKIQETEDVVTFLVRRIDDRLVKTSLPGQYVTVQMPMPDGVRQPRQYSLTRADDGEHRQFAVKRVHGGGKPDGEVSNLLYETVDVGDVLTMSLPFGDVVLDDSGRPVVFASAGIGITPMAGMLSHLVAGRSRLPIRCCTPTSTRRSSPCAGRSSATSRACRRLAARLVREQAHSNEPVAGVHPGMMNLDAGRAAGRRHLLPLRPAAVHAGACAAR